MSRLSDYLQRWLAAPKVRPWALAGPVIVLLVCVPLLRPLRHPASMNGDEAARLATARAIVEDRTLALPADNLTIPASELIHVNGRTYSDQPPMFAVLMSGPYWVMHRFGKTIEKSPVLVPYLLTLICVTIPVAGAAGLVYRMARVFELARIWRAALGLAVVVGSGLLSYAVVLNAYAPVAVLLLGAMGCVIHVAASASPARSSGWLLICGFCSALAATLDPSALLPAILIAGSILAIRIPIALRLAGVALFALGATPPLAVHASILNPIVGDAMPRSYLRQLGQPKVMSLDDELTSELDSQAAIVGRYVGRLYCALIGSHGLFSHFPVLLLGLAGVGAVMHRNWLPSTKSLAAASAITMGGIIGVFAFSRADWRDAMFATKWFIVFTPMVLFWTGAWLRHGHSRVMWGVAASLMFISATVSLIGATGPCPPGGFQGYTVAGAIENLIRAERVAPDRPPALAITE